MSRIEKIGDVEVGEWLIFNCGGCPVPVQVISRDWHRNAYTVRDDKGTVVELLPAMFGFLEKIDRHVKGTDDLIKPVAATPCTCPSRDLFLNGCKCGHMKGKA